MATSVKIAGSKYTYTISNIQNSITLTPSNRNSRYGAVFAKPTITRQKSGTANTRYFRLQYITPYDAHGTITPSMYVHATYSASFTASGTTATVSEISTSLCYPLGYQAKRMLDNNVKSCTGFFMCMASEESAMQYPWDGVSGACTFAVSGWTPSAPTINAPTLSQSTPDSSVFGYIANYTSASWSASGNGGSWSYSLNGRSGTITPAATLSLSANGASASSGSGTGTRSASLGSKLVAASSITASATISNTLGGAASATRALTVQPYSKPIVNGLALGRVSANNEANHASMSVGWVVDALNKDSNVQQGITSGAITATWEAEDLSDQGTVFASGSFDIISNGNAMTDVTGTKTATLVDTSGNSHNVYDPDKSYRFSVHITDRIGESSATITAILNSNFYIICVREGGRGIGFGIVPPDDAFYVNMPANFQALTRSGSGTQADPYVYSGGINDEALLTQDTIDAIEAMLS